MMLRLRCSLQNPKTFVTSSSHPSKVHLPIFTPPTFPAFILFFNSRSQHSSRLIISEYLTSLLKRLVTLKTSKKKTISCWQTMCQHLIRFHWSWEAQNSFCFRDCSSGRPHSAFAHNKSKKLALFNYISYFQRYFTCLYWSHPIRWPDGQKWIFMVI